MSEQIGHTKAETRGESLSRDEKHSIEYADADGWRCFFPLTRGHLTAAEARAVMRAERGLPPESPTEAAAAEAVLAIEGAFRSVGHS